MIRFLFVAAALVSVAACKDKTQSDGLPPAKEWSANTNTLPPAEQPNNPRPNANPHAGMDMGNGNNPHAGMDMGATGSDPHAGLDMNNPHGAGGPDVSQMGLPPPDPNRKIDPSHRIAGSIKPHMKAADRLKAGGAIFLTVKKAGPDGAATGAPLAVEKITWGGNEAKFELTEAQAMIAGTELTGDVVVTARYDQDGDAISKQPGDVVGSARVTVPAENVTITLDDILQ